MCQKSTTRINAKVTFNDSPKTEQKTVTTFWYPFSPLTLHSGIASANLRFFRKNGVLNDFSEAISLVFRFCCLPGVAFSSNVAPIFRER